MLFIIDGDNAPGTRTKGIELLDKEDAVIICTVITNKYYQNEDNLMALQKTTKASIRCALAPPKKQSADFLLALKAQDAIAKGEKEIYIVSGDAHASTIAELLCQEYQESGVTIGLVANIHEGVFSDLSKIQNLEHIEALLRSQFGAENGTNLYHRIRNLLFRHFCEAMPRELISQICNESINIPVNTPSDTKTRLLS